MDLRQRFFLARFATLTGGEDPDHRIGAGDKGAGRGFVFGLNRVEARSVDDIDTAQLRQWHQDLDVVNIAGGIGRQFAQRIEQRAAGEFPRMAIARDDATPALRAVSNHVDRRGGRSDAGRRDIGADEGVDERRLAAGELAHHGDQQRLIEI